MGWKRGKGLGADLGLGGEFIQAFKLARCLLIALHQ